MTSSRIVLCVKLLSIGLEAQFGIVKNKYVLGYVYNVTFRTDCKGLGWYYVHNIYYRKHQSERMPELLQQRTLFSGWKVT